MKKILVMMSSYNGEKYIEAQIESIMSQNVNASVILRIRDDGSRDNTCEIVETLQKKYDNRIELIKGTNIGYNASFFELLNTAKDYDYYAFSDQDDVWLSDKLQTAINWLDKENNAKPLLYACTSYIVYDDLKSYGQTRKQQRPFDIFNTLVQNICPGHNQVMNNALLEIVKREKEQGKIYIYDSLITNLAMLYGKIIFNNEPHTYYRQHGANEFGYGKGKLGKLLTSYRHVKTGDGKKNRRQIEYIAKKHYTACVESACYEEICRYLDAKTFWQRLKYVFSTKLWRQSKAETIALYLAIVMKKI